MIIGTAGHIDHGKTSLVKALSGIETDRLEEEKRRGITIDLGFAYFTAENGARLGFVDMPGHEKLIHTMATGAASLDFALLVIAADDGIMPQTREHFDILKLLGVKRGAVVLTRSDLVDNARIDVVTRQVEAELFNNFLEDAPVFVVSSYTGEGIETLRSYLASEALSLQSRTVKGRFRHAVDRVFTLKGTGTVVTGTVLSGRGVVGQAVAVAPKAIGARIRSLHVQGEAGDETQAGDRAALNLTGENIAVDRLKRGDMVVDPFLNAPSNRFDVKISVLASEPKPLNQWFPVRFHHAAEDMAARLVFLESDVAQPGCEILAQIITERPVITVTGDRFLLRDTSARRTIGGGMVIDPQAPERKRRTNERLMWLNAMAASEPAHALGALLALPPHAVDWQAFCRARNLTEAEAEATLAEVCGRLIGGDGQGLVLSAERQERLRSNITTYLAAFHESEPDLPGIGLEKLRRDIAPEIRAPLFRTIIDDDIKSGLLKIHGAWVGLATHETKLCERDAVIWQKVEPVLNGALRFRPPRTRDFALELDIDEADMRRIFKSLSRMGKVYEVAQDYFFPRAVLHEIVTVLQDIADKNTAHEFVAADLRDRLDNGRKVAILILEFFDRHGVTLRRGDIRRLNRHRLDLFV